MSDNKDLPIIILSPTTPRQLEEFHRIYDMNELHEKVHALGYRLVIDTNELSAENRIKIDAIKRENIFHEGDMVEQFLATVPKLELTCLPEDLNEPQSIKGKHYPDGASYHKFRK